METSAHHHAEITEMCCPSCSMRTPASAVEGHGIPIDPVLNQSPVGVSAVLENLRLHQMTENGLVIKKDLWFLHPNPVLFSHRNISERTEGSNGPQKIFFSCSKWFHLFLLTVSQTLESKSFLSHLALTLNHIFISLGLWSSSHLLIIALLFHCVAIFCTENFQCISPNRFPDVLLLGKLLLFGKWLLEEVWHEELITLGRKNDSR